MGTDHSYRWVKIPDKPAPTRQTPALWTNTNPTNTFGETTVTLTESIESFSFVEIEYCASNTTTTSAYSVYFTISEFKKLTSDTSTGKCRGCLVGSYNSTLHKRYFYYSSNTRVFFSTGIVAASSNTQNKAVIPLAIYGII